MTSFKISQAQGLLVEILGWYGLVAFVIAYGSVSFSFISPTGYLYQLLNLSSAVGLGLVAFAKRAYQNGILNLAWASIAVAAIIHLLLIR